VTTYQVGNVRKLNLMHYMLAPDMPE